MRPFLRSSLILAVVAAAPLVAAAATTIDWATTEPESGEVVGDEVHMTGEGAHLLVVIDDPGITSDNYVVSGSIRYENVTGPGYLEMWSYFADGGAFFSRTLAAEGPMASLQGSSAGRYFELPFFLNGAAPPDRLEISVILPHGGDVWVGALTLEGTADSGQWWPPEQTGIIGAVAGTTLGLAGALVGILAVRGRNSRTVTTILRVVLVVGAVIVLAGFAALVIGQPGHVWAPLLVIGGVAAVVAGTLIPVISKRLAEAELHRIHALDSTPR